MPSRNQKSYNKAYREANPAKIKKLCKEWREKNRDYHKNWGLKKKYGITLDERNLILTSQGERCAICRGDDPGNKNGWVVDHCHRTQVLRGILCHHCNLLLGNSKDTPAILSAAITYLGKFQNGGQEAAQ